MESEIDLLSTMSPKAAKNCHPLIKKAPTRLALKKHFRRSSLLHVTSSHQHSENVIVIDSSSSSSSSNPATSVKAAERVEGEPHGAMGGGEEVEVALRHLPKGGIRPTDRNSAIERWVQEVNSRAEEAEQFRHIDERESLQRRRDEERGIFFSGEAERPNRAGMGERCGRKSGDEKSGRKSGKGGRKSEKEEGEVAGENKYESLLGDSFGLDLSDSAEKAALSAEELFSPERETEPEAEDIAKLLDSVYGNSWRVNEKEVLRSTDPHEKKQPIRSRMPQTEKPKKSAALTATPSFHPEQPKSNRLLDTLHRERFKKALELSPWLPPPRPTKLVFDAKENDRNTINLSSDSDSTPSAKPRTAVAKRKPFTEPRRKRPPIPSDSDSEPDDYAPRKTNASSAILADTAPKCYTFLESLSVHVPLNVCEYSARIYRSKFKQRKDELIERLFKLYNERIFGGRIPMETPIVWNDRMRGTAGFCYSKKVTHRDGRVERSVRIALSTKVVDSADRVRDTLVHEMCHAATWIANGMNDGHGPLWRGWADRAEAAFPELPPIKRCHQYDIHTKYTYRCIKCGYSIGRHSKSLNQARKRCGYCYGEFECLLNKVNQKGEKKMVPSTPKKEATGFALFVKENYSSFKQPSLKHGDVMKLLGQKFSAMKVQKSEQLLL